MGLSAKTNTKNNLPNIIDEVFRQHKDNDERLAFSICFNTYNGGYMNIGGYRKELVNKNQKTYTIPYYDDDGFYNIKIGGIKVGE